VSCNGKAAITLGPEGGDSGKQGYFSVVLAHVTWKESAKHVVKRIQAFLTKSSPVMDEEDDDDIYAPEEEKNIEGAAPLGKEVRSPKYKDGAEANEDEEEGEEVEEEGSDSVRTKP
jgi:hypothetical protein